MKGRQRFCNKFVMDAQPCYVRSALFLGGKGVGPPEGSAREGLVVGSG